MAEYSRIARGSFTTAATPVRQFVNLPFQPTQVRLINASAYGLSPSSIAQNAVTTAFWDISMGQGFAAIEYIESASSPWIIAADSVITGGIATFSAGLALQYGAKKQVIGITAANPAVVNVTAHGYAIGDTVILGGLAQSASTGMQQIAGIPFTISAVTDANHFTIKWDASGGNYTAISGSPTGAYVMRVLNPFIYAPQDNVISALTLSTTTTVVTTMYHNLVVGQQIAFRIPTVWGTTQLNSLPNTVIPGSPIYGYVTSITDNWTFVCSINSTGYTAFNVNQPFANYPGEQFPQVVPVGDVNTGGALITATSPLYPSPSFPTGSGGAYTINGPAIQGAFVNNTAQGFVVGLGVGVVDTSAKLLTASSLYIYEATYFDIG